MITYFEMEVLFKGYKKKSLDYFSTTESLRENLKLLHEQTLNNIEGHEKTFS